MLNLFTDNWDNPPILNEGEKMIRIMTSNDTNILYAIVDENEAWDGEGYYRISLSSGGQWSNEGPAWYDEITDLARDIDSASIDDVTLGYAEKVREFQEYELDALLGDHKDDFDVDGIIAYATKPCSDGNRYWVVDEDELAENLPFYDMTLDE